MRGKHPSPPSCLDFRPVGTTFAADLWRVDDRESTPTDAVVITFLQRAWFVRQPPSEAVAPSSIVGTSACMAPVACWRAGGG
jgi:hypothetical protein